MNKSIITLIAVCIYSLSFSALADVKLGVINVNKIFIESPQIAQEKLNLKRRFEIQERELFLAQRNFQKLVEFLNKNAPTMRQDIYKNEQQKLFDQQKKLQEMAMKLQNESNAVKELIFERFAKKLENAVSKVAYDKKIDVVFAKAGLAYSKADLDITNDVINQLKK